MISLFPRDDTQQRLRIKRYLLGIGFYAIWLLIVLMMQTMGLMELPRPWMYAAFAGVAVSNLIFFVLLRTGASKRFEDPSMTFAQLVTGLSWCMVLLASTSQGRDLILMTYVMPMIFGMFQLSARGFFRLAAFAIIGYLGILWLDLYMFPHRFNPWHEALRLTVICSMFFWTAFFGLHVSRLKAQLRNRTRELQRMVDEVTVLAERDDLTKVYNRRFIMESLAREKARADRTGIPFSLCIFDLDNFKLINDRFGHLAGDRVLTAFAERARSELRSLDVIQRPDCNTWFGRYGGEEFIVLLPNTSLLGARNCAERIRHITADRAFEDVLRITVSAGVTEYRQGESAEETLRRADQALYDAKQGGRNQVVYAGDLGTTHVPSDFGHDVVVGLFNKSRRKH
jgi:diguanylate cyclase (GGDEF)-like protein